MEQQLERESAVAASELRSRRIATGRAVIGLVGALSAGLYLLEASSLPAGSLQRPGAAAFPVVVGVGLGLVSVAVLVEALRKRHVPTEGAELPRKADVRRAALIAGATVVLVAVLPVIGVFLAAAVFIAMTVRFLGGSRWWTAGLAGALISGAIYLLFVLYLRVPLPNGIFA